MFNITPELEFYFKIVCQYYCIGDCNSSSVLIEAFIQPYYNFYRFSEYVNPATNHLNPIKNQDLINVSHICEMSTKML